MPAFIIKFAKQLCFFPAFPLILAWADDAQNPADLWPTPELGPQQVVKYQLSVLQHNDEPSPDAGIEKAFRFASPANQRSVGPIDHFKVIVHSPAYAPLLNAKEAVVLGIKLLSDQAWVLARVVSTSDAGVFYLFILSKQTEDKVANCWMTDGVIGFDQPDDSQPKSTI